jgi:hypothetical protein
MKPRAPLYRVPVLALAMLACAEPVSPDPCVGLSEAGCRADSRCVAVPHWGAAAGSCTPDERGFTEGCPWIGCRSKDMTCPTLEELTGACPLDCPDQAFAIDPETGCRICRCERRPRARVSVRRRRSRPRTGRPS